MKILFIVLVLFAGCTSVPSTDPCQDLTSARFPYDCEGGGGTD